MINYPDEIFPTAYKLLHEIGRNLIRKIEEKRERINGKT